MNTYVYDGPIKEFDKVICKRWYAVTIAPTKAKARNNIKFQFKTEYGKMPSAKINLVEDVVLVRENI